MKRGSLTSAVIAGIAGVAGMANVAQRISRGPDIDIRNLFNGYYMRDNWGGRGAGPINGGRKRQQPRRSKHTSRTKSAKRARSKVRLRSQRGGK